MKVVITGASGFIGRHLSNFLKSEGVEVVNFSRQIEVTDCDRIYHLACPSSSIAINTDPLGVMNTILDVTRSALSISPDALFVNASSMGVKDLDDSPQGCYNVAKLCMESYVKFNRPNHINYRIPAVYGIGMSDDSFIKRCVDGRAYYPLNPDQLYYISHIEEVVNALVELRPITIEEITLGEIFKQFGNNRRPLDR